MNKIIEARILLEEFGDLARQGQVVEFVELLRKNCSVMLFDEKNQCYKLFFKNEYWESCVEAWPDIERYYYGVEYDN